MIDTVDYIGYIGGVCLTINMLPQLYKTYQTKSATDISWIFLFLNLTGLGLYTIYGIMKNLYTISIPTGCNVIITLLLMILKKKY
tara:strand:+ start:481 stop:735 length:255 start_codon:yes stop_codon:yes gene_type:complete